MLYRHCRFALYCLCRFVLYRHCRFALYCRCCFLLYRSCSFELYHRHFVLYRRWRHGSFSHSSACVYLMKNLTGVFEYFVSVPVHLVLKEFVQRPSETVCVVEWHFLGAPFSKGGRKSLLQRLPMRRGIQLVVPMVGVRRASIKQGI